MPRDTDDILLSLHGVRVYFPVEGAMLLQRLLPVRAVDGVSLSIHRGETMGLVGESGSGKSTLGRAILQLIRPTAGEVYLDGIPLHKLSGEKLRRTRQRMQLVFQDPYSSLDPHKTVGSILVEPLKVHSIGTRKQQHAAVIELLNVVKLESYMTRRYPHELSGGQRQRISIARALAFNPDLVVCDEPVSALDVSIRAQIINLLEDLQREFHLTYIFIAHDLSVVQHISDRVAVMYCGKIVELATRDELYDHPLHPYTQALLSAVPIPDPRTEKKRRRIVLTGEIPNPASPPSGCRFHTRCPAVRERCRSEEPLFIDRGSGHWVACFVANL